HSLQIPISAANVAPHSFPTRRSSDLRVSLRDRLAQQPSGYDFTIGRILAIYAGLMVTLLLAALDQTIVATALPRIVERGEQERRSEEHTSELQSRGHLVCRLLLEKKK